MIEITDTVSIDEDEIRFEFTRSSGPGGQNVNKVSTAVQLRFDVRGSPSLPEDVRERLTQLAGKRITGDGVLIIDAHRFRTQERNRKDAIERLVHLISQAARRPKRRRKTRPTAESQRRRLDAKRRRGEVKRWRRRVSRFDE
jgi:ribosome-associated protein